MSTTATRMTIGADTAWMSWLRVAAICGVVAIHTVGYNAARPDARDSLRGAVALLLDWGSVFAVPVFVMLSGATMLDPSRFRSNREFLKKRAMRLLPAVIFWHVWYFAFLVLIRDRALSIADGVGLALSGQLYTALYFFWIVLGLSLLTPLLVPFIREHGRQGALVAGLAAAAVPVLTLATMGLRDASVAFADSALTWWIPYLGLFLLGYALRGVVLRGVALAAVTVCVVGLAVLNAWQWHNPEAPAWLQSLSPVGYYSFTGIAYACAVYLAAQGLVSPRGPLRTLTRPVGVRTGRLLGDATLGIYGLHLTILYFVQQAGIGGERLWSHTTHDLLLRLAVVLVATWAIVLVLRRIPVVRAVL